MVPRPTSLTVRRPRETVVAWASVPQCTLSARLVSPHAGGAGLRNKLAIGFRVTRDAAIEPPASGGPVSVRALTAPTRREIEGLAEIFEQYRAHYGQARDAARSAAWLERNLKSSRFRAFVAADQGRSIGFAITMEVPASLRLGHFCSSCRTSAVLASVERSSTPCARLRLRQAPCDLSCRRRTTMSPHCVSTRRVATRWSRVTAH